VPFTHFVTPQRGGVMALDTGSGAIRWTVNYPRPAADSTSGAVSTVVSDNAVLVGGKAGFWALPR